jgi:hypothetical protein
MMVVSIGPAFAETVTVASPQPYKLSRADDDYLYLRDSVRHSDFWDPIKYIPLNAPGSWYLSLGGEARERYEYFDYPKWGAGPP